MQSLHAQGTGWGEAAGGQQGRAVSPGTGWGEAAGQGSWAGQQSVLAGGEAAGGLRLGSVAKIESWVCIGVAGRHGSEGCGGAAARPHAPHMFALMFTLTKMRVDLKSED